MRCTGSVHFWFDPDFRFIEEKGNVHDDRPTADGTILDIFLSACAGIED